MNGFAALDFPCACCYIADMAASTMPLPPHDILLHFTPILEFTQNTDTPYFRKHMPPLTECLAHFNKKAPAYPAIT
jgi:hypothetical protein